MSSITNKDPDIEVLAEDEGEHDAALEVGEIYSADQDGLELEPGSGRELLVQRGAVDAPQAGIRDIVRYDPLDAYLREIARIPQMDREEEHQLAVQYRQNQDRDAAKRLIMANLWLVVKVARDYERAARSVLDLIQEGNMGLMEAVRNFDPDREVRFPSYAVWWIKAYIIRYVIANWKVVKIGTTQAQRKLFFNLNREKERLERDGFYPTPKMLADRLNVRESDVTEMEQRLGSADMSLEAPLPGDNEGTLLGVMPAEQSSAEELVAQRERDRLVRESFAQFALTLNDKELIILQERLLADEKATLQDLSDRFHVSRERIRQIETRVKEKLRSFLEKKFGDNIGAVIDE